MKGNVSVIAANVHPNENFELVVVDPARRMAARCMAARLLVVDPAGTHGRETTGIERCTPLIVVVSQRYF